MAINTDETYSGSFFDRLGEMGAILDRMYDDWRTGGLYETDFDALVDAIAGGITAAGDVQKERDIAQYVRRIFEKGQTYMEDLANDLKKVGQSLLARHVSRDLNQGDLLGGNNEFEGSDLLPLTLEQRKYNNQLLAEQLHDPAGTAPAVTVQSVTVTATSSAGGSNVGNGILLLSTKRGDGLTSPFLLGSKGRFSCVRSSGDDVRLLNHEEFNYRDNKGPGKMHPDWALGTRGSWKSAASDVLYRVADPTAWAARGNLLANGFEVFSSNHPVRWTALVGTAGTHYLSSSTAYFGSYSLELSVTATLVSFKQVFGSAAGTESQWEANAVLGFLVRIYKPAGLSQGVIRFRLTDSSGTTLNDDQGTANTVSVDLTTLTNDSWNNVTNVFRTPKGIISSAEFRWDVTTAIQGAAPKLDSMILTKMQRPFPGYWYGCLFAGSTPFKSDKNRTLADYFDVTATNDNGGGAKHARITYQKLAQAVLDTDEDDTPWPESGTPTIDDSAIA